MNKPLLSEVDRLRLLELPPSGHRLPLVLDTDTYNEIDDQFAVVYAMLAHRQNKLDLQAVYAAPFHNERSDGPADGMEKSYEEILRLLDRLEVRHEGLVHRGSTCFLPAPDQPVNSAAVEDLVRRAMDQEDGPLYVAALGAITNVASAVLLEPRIVEKIVVIWLGGQPPYWYTAADFNLQQDLTGSRLIFDSGVPLVQIPCKNAAEHIRTTWPEIQACVAGQGRIGVYLAEIYRKFCNIEPGRSKVIWDIAAIGWLLNPGWVPTVLCHSPLLNEDLTFTTDPRRHLIRQAIDCRRDEIVGDLFHRLREANSIDGV